MSRFEKLTYVLWHFQCHIIWAPKYRYRILTGLIGNFVRSQIVVEAERSGCKIVELNIQEELVHLLIKVPPKISISTLIRKLKGKSAI